MSGVIAVLAVLTLLAVAGFVGMGIGDWLYEREYGKDEQ
jgi:hypothetical protein